MDSTTMLKATDRLTLSEAADLAGTHGNTVHRWRLNGVRGIRLRTQRIGGRHYTCRRWLDEFISALNSVKAAPTQRNDIESRCRAAGV